MLPPVRALSSSDTTYASQQAPQPSTTNGVSPRMPLSAAPTLNSDISALAKASILALSSQLQLSQNAAVLAETLGKMMNIPRNEGEAIDAYVDRLTQAIRTLPANERAALELQLGKALQGLSLKILAEVLKNPAGPDAAKLAMLLEMSRYKERDLVAKAVVSSYRQNTGADMGTSPRPVSPTATAQQSQPAQQGASQSVSSANPTPQGAGTGPMAPAATVASSVQPGQMASAVADGDVQQANANGNAAATGDADVPSRASGNPTAPSSPSANPQTAPSNLTFTPASPTTANGEMLPSAADLAKARPTAPMSDPSSEQPAAIRNPAAGAGSRPETVAVRTPQVADRVNVRTQSVTGYTTIVAETFKNLESQLLNALAANRQAASAEPTLSLFTAADSDAPIPLDPKASAHLIAASTNDPDREQQSLSARPAMEAAQTPATRPADVNALLDQPALQSAAAALIKEGTPLPFVGYPAAPEEAEQDNPHRGRWPSSGDEGESGDAQGEQPEQDDEQEERLAANDEGADSDQSDAQQDGEAADGPESYYLRMAGFI